MTAARLAQLRGCLANLRDSEDDYRGAVLAQWAIGLIAEQARQRWYFDTGHGDDKIRAGHRSDALLAAMAALADALGLAPDRCWPDAKGELT